MSKEIKINVAANLIGMVAPFIGRGDIRFYLDGISIRPAKGGGAIIAATNGHGLAMVLDRSAVCEEEVIVRVNGHLLQACAAMPMREQRRLEMRNGRLTVTRGEGKNSDLYIQAGDPVIDAKFPDIFHAVPDPKSLVVGLMGTIKQEVLDKVNQAARFAMKSNGKSGAGAIQFWTADGSRQSPTVVRLTEIPEWFSVIMPAHYELMENPTPQFAIDGKTNKK